MPNSILPQDQDGQELFNAIISFFCTFGMQNLPILKACGIARLIDPVSMFCAIEEYYSIEKTASETTEARGVTDVDKVIMQGFDAKTSFRKRK